MAGEVINIKKRSCIANDAGPCPLESQRLGSPLFPKGSGRESGEVRRGRRAGDGCGDGRGAALRLSVPVAAAHSWRTAGPGSPAHGAFFHPERFNTSVNTYLASLQTGITSRSWCLRVGHGDAALINNLSLVSAISIPFCLIVFQETSREQAHLESSWHLYLAMLTCSTPTPCFTFAFLSDVTAFYAGITQVAVCL